VKIQRTLPPTAAPLGLIDLWNGFKGFFSGARFMKLLEEEIKHYFGVKKVFLVSSGKAALFIILRALKILAPGKNEVLIPAYTCFSVPSAVVKAGLKVVLCDINPSTLDFDYGILEKNINQNTLCIIPGHLFGIPSNIDEINRVCKKRGIFVVEDAAQAMGSTSGERLLGTLGDVGFFSLGRGKPISCGSGGIVVTNSDHIAKAIEEEFFKLRFPGMVANLKEFCKIIAMNIFIHPSLYWIPVGMPFLKLGETFFHKDFPVERLSSVQGGLGRGWKRRLKKSTDGRIKKASMLCRRLGSIKGTNDNSLTIPYLRLPVIVNNQDRKERICSVSYEKGLGIARMYPTPINEIREIQDQFKGLTFPSAKFVAERLITIPTHEFVGEKDYEKIIDLLAFEGLKAISDPFDFPVLCEA
jgi:dTDP-4-amino-4,6-dideoxygalactose transaminase